MYPLINIYGVSNNLKNKKIDKMKFKLISYCKYSKNKY